MFIGAVPMPVVNQLLRSVDCSSWREIFVCCSGSFRVDRALKERYPQKAVRGNDVSLVSSAVGTLLTGGELAIAFKDRLAFIEEREFADYAWRVAAVIVALRLSQFSGKNAYAQGHFEHCRQNFDTYLAKAHEKVLQLRSGVQLDEYCAGDFRDHADRAMREGAGIAGFMPTYKGGYERMYRFLDENTDWPRPSFRTWDPKDLPDWLSIVAKSDSPYFVVTDHELAGFKAGDRISLDDQQAGVRLSRRWALVVSAQAQSRGVVRVPGSRSGNARAADRCAVGAGVQRAAHLPAQHVPGQGHRPRDRHRELSGHARRQARRRFHLRPRSLGPGRIDLPPVGLLHRPRTTAGETDRHARWQQRDDRRLVSAFRGAPEVSAHDGFYRSTCFHEVSRNL